MTQWLTVAVLYGIVFWCSFQLLTVAPSCVFDEIKQTNALKTGVDYGAGTRSNDGANRLGRPVNSHGYYSNHSIHGNRRVRREESLYKHIRIEMVFMYLEYELSDTEMERLKDVVKEVVETVTNILSVVPVDGNLILSRSSDACHLSWQSGINKDKCAMEKSSYRGETCSLDAFMIPDDHLEGMYVWNHTHTNPVRTVKPQGQGVENTDYILYVRSATTNTCLREGANVIAYATYCQLDQNDRPIAGYLNFCPDLVRDPNYDEQKLLKVALHELFHALGFSADLFPKFKRCTISGGQLSCQTHPHVVNQVQGAMRLVTPKAVEHTSAHFGCQTHQTVNDFGPILQTQNGAVKSHWDAAFMQGSLMAPTIGLPYQSVLDPITLALFEDSGWYQVNYFYADMFIWGKGSGCNFGLNPACEHPSDYFCTGDVHGCHYLHLDKGTCDTDTFLHNCRVFKSIPQDNCQNPDNNLAAHVINVMGEICTKQSRCFMSNLTKISGVEPTEWSGHCYLHQCNETGHVSVQVGDEEWTECPFGQLVQVPNYTGALRCPLQGVLCMEVLMPTTPPTPLPTSTERFLTHNDKSEIVCINLIFDHADYTKIESRDLLSLFRECVSETIQDLTGISPSRMSDISLTKGSVIYQCNLHPAEYSDDGPPTHVVIEVLERTVVVARNFSFKMPPSGPVYIAQSFAQCRRDFSVSQMDGGPVVSNSQLSAGAIAGAVLGALVGAAIIGLLMFLVQRHYTLQSRVTTTAQRARQQDRGGNPGNNGSAPPPSAPSTHSRISPEDITHVFYAQPPDTRQNPRGHKRCSLRTKNSNTPPAGGIRESPTGGDNRETAPRSNSANRGYFSAGDNRLRSAVTDTGGVSESSISSNSSTQPLRARSAVSTRDVELDSPV